jgi:hypothetical protein
VTRIARRACVAFAALFVITFAFPSVAGAAPGVAVSTDPTGAHVKLVRRGTWVEVRAPGASEGSGGGGATATGCQRRWVPTKYPNYLYPGKVDPDINPVPMPASPGPEYIAYHVYCGGVYITSVWLPPSAFEPTAGALDVRAIAEQLARDLPYPAATVRVSPEGRGLTGLESWFWVEGYAAPLHDAVDELGFRVEVEAVPASVQWDFGDDSPAQPGTLGQAAPARSDVVHTYERTSRAGPITIRASVRLDVRFRANDEPWQALDPVFRTATRAYPVAQSRAALVAPR